MRSTPPLAALTLAVAAFLTGCVPQASDVDPPPQPTTAPVFASDEEALAAATDAYKAYLAMSDLIAQEGGKDPERIAPFVTEETLTEQVGQFLPYSQGALHSAGSTTFDSVALQQSVQSLNGIAEIEVYLCLDVSAVTVLDDSGSDVTPADRMSRLPLEIGFQSTSTSSDLFLNRSEIWQGSNFC